MLGQQVTSVNTQAHTALVIDSLDHKGRRVEQRLPHRCCLGILAPNRGLCKVALGNLGGAAYTTPQTVNLPGHQVARLVPTAWQ